MIFITRRSMIHTCLTLVILVCYVLLGFDLSPSAFFCIKDTGLVSIERAASGACSDGTRVDVSLKKNEGVSSLSAHSGGCIDIPLSFHTVALVNTPLTGNASSLHQTTHSPTFLQSRLSSHEASSRFFDLPFSWDNSSIGSLRSVILLI